MWAALCPVPQAQVSEPLKGTLKWTTQKHYTHPSMLQIRCTKATGTVKLPSHSVRLGRAEHGPAEYDLCNPGAHPAGSPSVGCTRLLQRVSSAWAPLVHSFSTFTMKQMPVFSTGDHSFGMLVSVLPLQCFYEGLPGIFCVCRALWYFLEKLAFLNPSGSELGSRSQCHSRSHHSHFRTCPKWLKMIFFFSAFTSHVRFLNIPSPGSHSP